MPFDAGPAPLFTRSDHNEPSVFRPEALLHKAREQKNIPRHGVPPICVLDPDGDIVSCVRTAHSATKSESWACFHTDLWEWQTEGSRFGVIGRAVGSPFAVLLAEQLFVSGCHLLISIASAGAIANDLPRPSYVLIEKALRDEGTSYHYLAPAPFAVADPVLLRHALAAASSLEIPIIKGISWTTDAPFRETAETIEERRRQGIHTVEMEAAALLAFAQARRKPCLAIAHVTNELGQGEKDFDKGADQGVKNGLELINAIARSPELARYCLDVISS